ncbi:hypothetical protein OG896_28495 [Streptomyces sp. NBC_00669]|uniref:hypothetical protein n=1 Tax=unclassified Streptomyces TaxID=2593676 RepID=UPI002E35C48E|nr:hypothetical protein [Streptomyces sp. NBC_00669]
MLSESDFRAELRAWVSEKSGVKVTDHSPIFADRTLRSVHIPELLLLMERLRGTPIEVEDLRPTDFRDIDTLVTRFGTRS